MNRCACGCGQEVNPGKQFVYGHNRRKGTPKRKPSTRIARVLGYHREKKA